MNMVVDMLPPMLATKKGSLCNQQIINNTIQISSHEVSGLNHFNLEKTNISYVLQRVFETLPRRKKKKRFLREIRIICYTHLKKYNSMQYTLCTMHKEVLR